MTNEERPVSPRLAIAIFLFPGIFAWFTLREGYTTKARVISFVYAGVVAFFGMMIMIGAGAAADKAGRDIQQQIDRTPTTLGSTEIIQPSAQSPMPMSQTPPSMATPQQNGQGTIGGTQPPPMERPSAQAKKIVAVNAAQLSADYEANEVAAQMRWAPYTLDVTGLVTSIDLDFEDKPVIMFQGSTQMNGAHASIAPGYEQRAAMVQKGSQLVVRCQGIGEIMGSPMLRDCAF